MFESATPDHYREKDLNALKEELESKIDERCQKISNELLSGGK